MGEHEFEIPIPWILYNGSWDWNNYTTVPAYLPCVDCYILLDLRISRCFLCKSGFWGIKYYFNIYIGKKSFFMESWCISGVHPDAEFCTNMVCTISIFLSLIHI